jgi:large subunit ribosomal protein L4e
MTKTYNVDGSPKGEMKLPNVFSVEYRPDLIKRAVLVIQSNKRQPYGANKLAGKRTAAHYHSRRHGRYTMMNREMARMKRTHGGPPGQQFRARFVPQAVSGRKAHPPKPEKDWKQKINKKERILAIKSAIAATINFDLVKKRHNVKKIELPIIVDDKLETINKTKDLKKAIELLKLKDDLERASKKKVRPGKGKMRGRKYKKKKSVLIVVNNKKEISKAGKNILGVDVCLVKNLNAELLAPGTQAGRLTIWSESAIKRLGEIYG